MWFNKRVTPYPNVSHLSVIVYNYFAHHELDGFRAYLISIVSHYTWLPEHLAQKDQSPKRENCPTGKCSFIFQNR